MLSLLFSKEANNEIESFWKDFLSSQQGSGVSYKTKKQEGTFFSPYQFSLFSNTLCQDFMVFYEASPLKVRLRSYKVELTWVCENPSWSKFVLMRENAEESEYYNLKQLKTDIKHFDNNFLLFVSSNQLMYKLKELCKQALLLKSIGVEQVILERHRFSICLSRFPKGLAAEVDLKELFNLGQRIARLFGREDERPNTSEEGQEFALAI
jgi:hypothetical protein